MNDRVRLHIENQIRFFNGHRKYWPGTYLDAFDFAGVRMISSSNANEVKNATQAIFGLYKRFFKLALNAPSSALLSLGIPAEAIQSTRVPHRDFFEHLICRADFAWTGEGLKLLELNVGTPGLTVEAFGINGAICREYGLKDPNANGKEALARALAKSLQFGIATLGRNLGDTRVCISVERDFTRDLDTAKFIKSLLVEKFPKCECVFFDDAHFDEEGLHDDEGKPIDILISTYSFLHLCRNQIKSTSNSILFMDFDDLHNLIRRRKLFVIGHPATLLIESKAVLAAIWNLALNSECFTKRETKLVKKYMLPTFLDAPQGTPFVTKPFFGDNGDTIAFYDRHGGAINRTDNQTYFLQPVVYQECINLPTDLFVTEEGELELSWVISCFVIGGQANGIVARAGRAVTDVNWWVVPLAISNNSNLSNNFQEASIFS